MAGQEKHDWNSHPWVRPAMDYVRYNFFRITPDKLLKFYYLMKKLKYSDEQFWAQMYAQL